MSQRTIVEFNHDFSCAIRDEPELFLDAIDSLMRNGANGNPNNERGAALEDALRRFGVTVTPTHHHSDDATVTLGSGGREYWSRTL